MRLEKAQISLLTGVEQHLCDLQLPSAGNCAVPEPDGQCFTAGHVSPADTEAEHPWDQDLQQPSASHTSPSNAMHKSHLISRDFVARCVWGKLILVQQRTEGQAGFKHGSKLWFIGSFLFIFFPGWISNLPWGGREEVGNNLLKYVSAVFWSLRHRKASYKKWSCYWEPESVSWPCLFFNELCSFRTILLHVYQWRCKSEWSKIHCMSTDCPHSTNGWFMVLFGLLADLEALSLCPQMSLLSPPLPGTSHNMVASHGLWPDHQLVSVPSASGPTHHSFYFL